MPHGFEYVIRPFQSPGSLGNIVIPGTPQRTPELARITWGGVGTMPATKLINPNTVVNTKSEVLDEQDRDVETKRIVGNDGESYVDVDRAKTLRLNSTEEKTPSLNSTIYRAGPTVDQALADYLNSFEAINQATATAIEKGKVTWNLKNG